MKDPADFFDIAISFTSRDPAGARLAAELHRALTRYRLAVFYYATIEQAEKALGERLGVLLPAIYRDRARLVVLVASEHYGETPWTRTELAAALARPNDDAGRPRVVPVSADGSVVPELPADILHLGSDIATPRSVTTAARLIARRCGARTGRLRAWWPLALPLLAAAAVAGQWLLPGALPVLTPWITAMAIVAAAFTLLALVIPALWLRQRRRGERRRLVVVTEGAGLQTFRRLLAIAGGICAALILGVLIVSGWNIAAGIILAHDISALAASAAPLEAMRRYEASRDQLARFEPRFISEFEQSIARTLSADGWLQFPALYHQFRALRPDGSPALEQAFWNASGTAALVEGDDVLDYIQTASALREDAPPLARRVFETALARLLEWQMSGNNFYYSFEGERAWMVYSQLETADGVTQWADAHRGSVLEHNPGLSPRILVYLAKHGDAKAAADVEARVKVLPADKSILEALGQTPLAPELAARISAVLTKVWTDLHAQGGPSPEGFALAAAMARQKREATSFFLERLSASPDEQERAHALNGLYVALSRRLTRDPAPVSAALLRARTAGTDLERFAASGQYLRARACVGRVAEDIATSLQIELASTPGTNRSPAGIVPPSPGPIEPEIVRRELRAYRTACGDRADPVLVAAVTERFGEDRSVALPRTFAELRSRYESLRQATPGTASDPGVLALVELIQAMGATKDPAAATYLESRFDHLPHGNMEIAAAESLLRLRGRFGATVLASVRTLVAMNSSVYRGELLAMIARSGSLLQDPAERAAIVRTVSQVSVSGDAAERGAMLDVLASFDPALARRRAFLLTLSSNANDRLEGIEHLWQLWDAEKKQ